MGPEISVGWAPEAGDDLICCVQSGIRGPRKGSARPLYFRQMRRVLLVTCLIVPVDSRIVAVSLRIVNNNSSIYGLVSFHLE